MDDLELVVDDIAGGGDGIARATDGRIVFVRGGVPGDRLLARVTVEKSRMIRADAREVLDPSPHRVDPPCPHVAQGCGGCGWQHVRVDAQRQLKLRIVSEALRRIGRLEHEPALGPSLPSEGFRTTVRGVVDRQRFAFRAARSHQPVSIESCLVAHPRLDDLIRAATFGSGSDPVDSTEAVEVTLRVGAATGERLAHFRPATPPGAELPADVVVAGGSDPAEAAHFHDEVHGHRFRISARSFFQTRTDGAAALVDAVRAAGGDRWASGRLVDLYGGVGLFAGCLGSGMRVTSVEASASSAADARANLAPLDADVVCAPVERWTPTPADLVVADPPRGGLGADAVRVVAATGTSRLVLVSCDAASYARDASLLDALGFRLASTTLVDLFPHTPHVELVSRFDRTS